MNAHSSSSMPNDGVTVVVPAIYPAEPLPGVETVLLATPQIIGKERSSTTNLELLLCGQYNNDAPVLVCGLLPKHRYSLFCPLSKMRGLAGLSAETPAVAEALLSFLSMVRAVCLSSSHNKQHSNRNNESLLVGSCSLKPLPS